MAISKFGSRLVVVGGWYQVILAIRIFSLKIFKLTAKFPEEAAIITLTMVLVGVLWFIVGVALIKSAKKMREEESCKEGSKRALIFSVIGLNVLSLIGAIVGLVKSKKPNIK